MRPPKHEFVFKSIKQGEKAYFRVIAVSDTRAKSLAGTVAWGTG